MGADIWVRLFIAVEVAPSVCEALAATHARLLKTGADIKWVTPERMHLTLVFLGDVPSDRAPAIAPELDACCAGLAPFEMEVGGLGFFGSPHAPRVIWAGISEGAEAITALQTRIRAAVLALGFKLEDRPFSAHLTLGRSRSTRNGAALIKALAMPCGTFGRTRVERVLLIKSELLPTGPVYSIVHAPRLGA